MQVHEGVCREGDVLSINILEGTLGERMKQLLLTQGIEVAVVSIRGGEVKLAVRAPGGMLIVEELVSPP
ncbi:carbon storage regulator [Pseudomonas resinovorans]|uniref:Carbon storage regulator n=1 Tax=Metapseudomonas resinovorans TaxID=53412 RepID=A0ABT4Y279_METRE|nr:carbon storage regulator [Pseudomonas resinovorans]MDA8482886.1 carbon storage regulator [Pseudomonas resinovorans]